MRARYYLPESKVFVCYRHIKAHSHAFRVKIHDDEKRDCMDCYMEGRT